MARNRLRKTKKTSEESMRRALDLIKQGWTARKAAKAEGVNHVTLSRYKKKIEKDPSTQLKPRFDTRRVFSDAQEKEITSYLIEISERCSGLTIKECRKLAYEYALKKDVKVPENWVINGTAGIEWFRSFLLRNQDLSVSSTDSRLIEVLMSTENKD